MAGKTSKTSVKSTAAKKTAKPSTAKSLTASKTVAKKATASKTAPEKKSDSKKTVKSAPAPVKAKSASAKPAAKSKAAPEVKSKASTAKKAAVKPSAKSAPKPEKTSSDSPSKKTVKKTSVKTDVAPKPEAKKTNAVKKTAKTAKPVQTQTVAKPLKKTEPVKAPTTKKSEIDSKKSQEVNVVVEKQEEAVQEQEQTSKPKAKRATKFMIKANAAIIAQLRQQLLQRRNEILSFYWGDLGSANVSSQASGDTADAATDSVHSEMRSQLAEKESQELTDINNALHKMETGEYGLCEECGMPIAVERLEAIPEAELCLKCQEELEEDGDYDNYSYYGGYE